MDRFEEHLELHRLDCLSSHRKLDNYEFVAEKLSETPPETLKPPRILNGDDLIAAGYTPGPEFARVLTAVEDAQLEGKIQNREQALGLAQTLFDT
ncbi:MAG: hypothetical protein GY953_56155 [bacterium]|nr:hypothetical protein [bacterium]